MTDHATTRRYALANGRSVAHVFLIDVARPMPLAECGLWPVDLAGDGPPLQLCDRCGRRLERWAQDGCALVEVPWRPEWTEWRLWERAQLVLASLDAESFERWVAL